MKKEKALKKDTKKIKTLTKNNIDYAVTNGKKTIFFYEYQGASALRAAGFTEQEILDVLNGQSKEDAIRGLG